MSATGRSSVRVDGDFYRTPAWAVRALLESEPLHGPILEPSCGTGEMMEALSVPALFPIVGVELDEDRHACARMLEDRAGRRCRAYRGDFLDPHRELRERLDRWSFAAVIGNPPYKHAAGFVRKSLKIVPPGGRVCMLLRLNFLGSSRKRLDVVGPGSGLARVIVLAKRPSFTGKGTDACEYAWMIWVRGFTGEARLSVYAGPVLP